MAQRGGKRPGAGRKPTAFKRVLHQTPVALAEAKIAQKLPWLVDKLMELVEGVEIERVDRNGQSRVYSQPPDRQAAEYLIDRVLGKPIARNEQGDPGDFDLDLSSLDADDLRAAFKVVKSA